LKDETRASAGHERLRARNLLVIVETALGVVVLVGAGLLLRSYVRLTQVSVGFKSEGVLTFRVSLPAARYRTEGQRTAFYRQLSERLEAVPGVASTAAISFLALTMSGRTAGVSIEGEPRPAPGQVRMADFRSVSPGYFGAMSIPVLAGRDVAWSDTPASQPSIVVSETAARSFWPNQNSIGKRLKLGRPQEDVPWLTVVGIVGNVRQLDLIRVPRPAMYLPASQDHGTGDTLRDWIVRTSGDPGSLMPAVRSTVWAVDPTLPITRARTLAQVRSASTASQQFNLLVVGLFAILAIVLAGVGLYGVTAYNVAQRTRELGIRVALGARPGALLGMVLAHGARLTLVGLALGTAAALAMSHVMSSLLFGIGARDPITFVGVALLLLLVSLAASFVPARRATRVDPVVALRA
jgi:predicted permease